MVKFHPSSQGHFLEKLSENVNIFTFSSLTSPTGIVDSTKLLLQYCLYVALIRVSRKIHMTKCILTRFDGVLEIVEPLLVFLPRDVYLDLLTGVQLGVAHAAVVLQVGGRPERSERVEMWLDAEKCIRSRCQSEGESERAGDQQRHLQGRSRSAGVHSVFKPKVTLPQEICIGNQCNSHHQCTLK